MWQPQARECLPCRVLGRGKAEQTASIINLSLEQAAQFVKSLATPK